MNQENETPFEPDNYILATAIDDLDSLTLEPGSNLPRIEGAREPFVRDLDRFERSAGEDRRQLSSNGLDLGQFGHAR